MVVDATDGGKTPGVFRNVVQALSEAKDGDTIFIRHGESRLVSVPPATLANPITVTLKPDDGQHPILVLAKNLERDTYLFKVPAGKLALEQLEIRLDPGQVPFDVLSIVQLGDTAQCSFKNCVLTLKSSGKSGGDPVKLNVATFLDADKMMKSESVASARVEFNECLVRGCGDLVSLRGCRLLHVDVKDSLIVLKGSLLDIQAANKNMSMFMDQGVHWKMVRSSIFTTKSIFALKSTGKGLTKTLAEKIEGCLLVALTPDQPVVLLEKDDDLKAYLDWKGEQNFYAQFEKDWKDQYPETKSVYEKITFPKLDDEALQSLWDVTPELLRPAEADQERLRDFGIPPEVEQRLLPAPPKGSDS